MIVDFHYHIARDLPRSLVPAAIPEGCILAQRESDNRRCLEIATRDGTACALFAHPRGSDWPCVVRLVAGRRALAYLHMEAVDKHDLPLIEPVLQASQEQDLPLVLHLSRHDQYLFSEPEALRCLDHILENYPDLRVIVSHCGGENARAVVEAAKNSSRVMLDASRIRETSERSLYKEPARLLDRIASSLSPRQVLYGSDQSWPQYVTNSAELEYLSEVFQPGELKEICIENGRSILKSLGRSRTYQDIC